MDTIYLYAWAAGLLDADGTVTIKRQRRRGKWNYMPVFQVTQVATYKGNANIYRLQKLFGGNVRKKVITKGGANKKDTAVIVWQATSKTAGECARKVLPFMVGKDRQVKLIVDYLNTFHGKTWKFHHLTEEETEQRGIFFDKMRSFQEKGFSPTTTKRGDA